MPYKRLFYLGVYWYIPQKGGKMENLTLENIVPIMTICISYIFGFLAKKFNWYEKKYIPTQNAIIGVVSAIIYCEFNPNADFVSTLFTALSGFVAGGIYDLKKRVVE